MTDNRRQRHKGFLRGLKAATTLATAALISLGVASVSAEAEDKLIKIGVLAALSGPGAADGEETVRGATLAADFDRLG